MTSTEAYSDKISGLKTALDEADCLVIGAGAGLSASGGLEYAGERFQENFADFIATYHFSDMYSATFYPYDSLEEYWAYMSRHINMNRYAAPIGKPYVDLLELVRDKDYFVITTNVDHQFQKAGFDKGRLFYTQGDYGLWQCSGPCHDATYDNAETVALMVGEQKALRIPAELIPRCPRCGKPMSMNLRCDDSFVQDEGWHAAAKRYEDFLRGHRNMKTLYLELGVGGNTPGIIKYPFWKMTAQNPLAVYACVNLGEAVCPLEIKGQSICIDYDAGKALADLKS
jgi:NAD-dependent SIR2 family protein deacetylase